MLKRLNPFGDYYIPKSLVFEVRKAWAWHAAAFVGLWGFVLFASRFVIFPSTYDAMDDGAAIRMPVIATFYALVSAKTFTLYRKCMWPQMRRGAAAVMNTAMVCSYATGLSALVAMLARSDSILWIAFADVVILMICVGIVWRNWNDYRPIL